MEFVSESRTLGPGLNPDLNLNIPSISNCNYSDNFIFICLSAVYSQYFFRKWIIAMTDTGTLDSGVAEFDIEYM